MRSLDYARADLKNGNSSLGEPCREQLGHHRYPSLGDAVVAAIFANDLRVHRADIDDAALAAVTLFPLGEHSPRDQLGQKEGAPQVHCQRAIETVGLKLQQIAADHGGYACIVDQTVYRPKIGFHPADKVGMGVDIAEIERVVRRVAAMRRRHRRNGFHGIGFDACHRDIETACQERQSSGVADARAAASHKRCSCLLVQVDLLQKQ